MEEADNDVNDAFDSILLAEDRYREVGYKDGLRDGLDEGRREGTQEGYQLGVKDGIDIGIEIGGYLGFSTTWLNLITNEDVQLKTCSSNVKLKTALEKFIELINSLKLDEPKNLDQKKLTDITSKYKQIQSLLSVSPGEETVDSKQTMSF